MRAVADTTTVVSGLLWQGAPRQVLDAARAGKYVFPLNSLTGFASQHLRNLREKMNAVSDDFARRMVELHGAAGTDWLGRLPTLIADCARRWSLTVLPPFPDLSYNYVAPAVRPDGREVVLKLGMPNPELLTEIEALRLFEGRGIVQLLDADRDHGVLLLERLKPGTQLSSLGRSSQAWAMTRRQPPSLPR